MAWHCDRTHTLRSLRSPPGQPYVGQKLRMVKYLAQGHTASGECGRPADFLPSSLVLHPREAEETRRNGAGAAPGLRVSREAFLYFWVIGLVQVGRWERPAKQGTLSGSCHLQVPLGSQPRLWRRESSQTPHAGGQCAPSVCPAPGAVEPPLPSSSLLGVLWKEERGPEDCRFLPTPELVSYHPVSSSSSHSHAILFQYSS